MSEDCILEQLVQSSPITLHFSTVIVLLLHKYVHSLYTAHIQIECHFNAANLTQQADFNAATPRTSQVQQFTCSVCEAKTLPTKLEIRMVQWKVQHKKS